MKITRIRTSNFRQHRSADIDLSNEQSDFVVIKGTMGAGKTNLLNAVTWCIYGEVDDIKNKGTQLLSDPVVVEMSEGEYRDVEVHVEIKLDGNVTAFINRKLTFKKNGNIANAYGEADLTVQVMRTIEKGYEVEPNAQNWIERNLPSRFKPYFLFDGEKLAGFFKESDAPRIKSAIQEVAQIDTLYRMQEKLAAVSVSLNQRAAKLTGADGDKLSEELGQKSKALEDKEVEIEGYEKEIQEAEAQESKFDSMLGDFTQFEKNIARKRAIDSEVETKTRELNTRRSEFHTRIRSVAPLVLLAPALKTLGEKIQEAHDNNELPPPISVDFLKKILADGKCICGTELDHENHAKLTIKNLIDGYAGISEVGDALNEHSTTYLVELGKIPIQRDFIDSINKSINSAIDALEKLAAEQQDLAHILEGQDDEAIKQMADQRKAARQLAASSRLKLATANSEAETLKNRIREIERDIDKVSQANAASRTARKKADFAKAAARSARELYESMNSSVRNAVAKSLEEQFLQMTWKENHFKSVNIDQDFHVSVLNQRNIEELDRLSAGERLCLAFAFSLTLSKEAGLNFPIVVDTPMGRLAPEVQENLSQVIAESTKGSAGQNNHQIILLMTETEYNERVAKVLDSRKPRILSIEFDTEAGESKVS